MGTELARLSTYSAVAPDIDRTLFAVLVALCNQCRAVNEKSLFTGPRCNLEKSDDTF